MNFRDSIESCVGVRTDLEFYCPNPIFTPLGEQRAIPDFKSETLVDYTGSKLILEFLDDDLFSSGGSSLTSLRKRVEHDFYLMDHFRHDFTFGCIAEGLDQNLDQFLPPIGQRETPDFIFIKESTLIVIEFCTTRSNVKDRLFEDFEKKKLTYASSLRSRIRTIREENSYEKYKVNRIEFYIIVTGNRGIVSNLIMSEDTITDLSTELCWRFNISNEVLMRLDMEGRYSDENSEVSIKKKIVKGVFKSIQFDWTNTEEKFKPFSKEMYTHWITPPSEEEKEYVSKTLMKVLHDSKETLEKEHFIDSTVKNPLDYQKRSNIKKCEEMIKEFRIASSKGDRVVSSSSKAVVQIPFWSPDEYYESGATIKDLNLGEDTENDPYFRVWQEAFYRVSAGEVKCIFENADLELRIAMGDEEPEENFDKPHKIDYHRVKLELREEDRIKLAQTGVWGKKYKFDSDVEAYREMTKKPFSLNHNTHDIDDFLEREVDIFKITDGSFRHSDVTNIISDAQKMHGCEASELLMTPARLFLHSRLGRFCSMVSDIAIELDLSLKQHVKDSVMIIKKLRHSNVHMLILPTNSSGHIFYSLLIPNDDLKFSIDSTVFKKTLTNGKVTWTEFMSVNASKLVNLAKTESIMLALLAHWAEYYGHPIWMGFKDVCNNHPYSYKDMFRMWKLNLLTLLSDKHLVEEQMTLNRYIFMEGFVDFPQIPKPYKILSKMNTTPRSRLEVWTINKSLEKMTRICENPFTETQSGSGKPKWIDLPHPYFEEKLTSPYHLINVFYIGYLKNKEETAESNSLIKMYEKILKLEDLQPETDDYLGLKDPYDPQYHEFSITFLKESILAAKNTLSSIYGSNIDSKIENTILEKISHEDLETFATLKASCVFNEEYYVPRTVEDYHRSKVISVIKPLMSDFQGDLTMPCQLVPSCLKELSNKGYMHIDLFRKPQHGGLREIYVLEIKARICQKMIEDMSRSICSLFSTETMTNPDSKASIPRNHTAESNKMGRNVTVCTSDDAKLWNQGHFVTKFAAMLCMFCPDYMHPFIIQCCQLWMKKRILIDPKLLAIFSKTHPFTLLEKNTSDGQGESFFKRFLFIHKGQLESKWHKQSTSFIETRSGMMQGILHYTSSLWHTIYLNYFKSFSYNFLKKKQISSFMSHLQSSDDSSVILSMAINTNTSLQSALSCSSLLFQVKAELGKYFGIYMSEKRTSNTVNIYEFNSEFYFGGALYRPTFRWIAASLNISEQESLASRQEESSNLLKDCLEGGSSFFCTHLIQISQALLHYRLLGSSVSSVFKTFLELSQNTKDPAYGYFLMDNPFMTGLAGFQYNLWLACKTTILGVKYRTLLDNRTTTENLDGKVQTLEVTTSGAFVSGVCIKYGDRKRWKKIIDDFNPNFELTQDKMDQRPEVLYRRAETKDEIYDKLTLKLMSPGVVQSLSKGNALTKIVASSVYILSKEVITDSSFWFKKQDISLNQKTSLLRKIVLEKYLTNKKEENLTEKQIQTLFSNSEDFEGILRLVSQFSRILGAQYRDYPRNVKTKIYLSEEGKNYFFSPDRLAAHFWFSMPTIPAAKRVRLEQWQNLKTVLPWLEDDPHITLEKSPFNHHTQLQNFLARLDKAKRVVRVTGAPIKTLGGQSGIFTALRQGFFPGFLLEPEEENILTNENKEYQHLLKLSFDLPYNHEDKIDIVKQIITNSQIELKPNMGSTRLNALSIIREVCVSQENWRVTAPSRDSILNKVFSHKLGIIGYWSGKQKWDNGEYTGHGSWTGRLDDADVIIDVLDKTIRKITVQSEEKFRRNLHLFRSWMKELKMNNPDIKGNKGPGLFCYEGSLVGYPTGCPVIVRPDYKAYYDPSSIRSLEVDIDPSMCSIRLLANYYNDTRKFTILSYKSLNKDINIRFRLKDEIKAGLFENRWFSYQSLSYKEAESLLTHFHDVKKVDSSNFQSWFRSKFFYQLYLMGLVRKNRPIKHPEEQAVFQDIDFFDIDCADVDVDMFGDEVDEDDLEDLCLQDIDMGFLESEQHNSLDSHPIVSNFIERIYAEIGRADFLNLFLDKVITQKNEKYLNLACLILDCTKTDFTVFVEKVDEESQVQVSSLFD